MVIDGNSEGLKRLLEEETTDREWEWRGKERKTALELAIVLGHSEIVTMLVNVGASPNKQSASGIYNYILNTYKQSLCVYRL